MKLLFDNVGPGSGGAGSANPTSPVTWNHVLTGPSPILLVGIVTGVIASGHTPGNEDGDFVINSVTANSIPMTLVPNSKLRNGGPTFTFGYTVWYYLLNPPTGTVAMSVAFTNTNPQSADTIECGSLSFTGVDQAVGFKPVVTAFADSANASISVPSDPNNMVAATLGAGSPLSAYSADLRWSLNINNQSAGGNGSGQTGQGSAGLTFTATVTPGDVWGYVALELIAAADSLPISEDDGDSFQVRQAP